MRAALFAVYLLFAGTAHAVATTIITFWSPDVVTIGADSREVIYSPEGDNFTRRCKIKVWRNIIVWALAGPDEFFRADGPPIAIEDIVNAGLSGNTNRYDAIISIEGVIRDKMQIFMDNIMKKYMPSDTFLERRKTLISAIIFAYVNDGQVNVEHATIGPDDSNVIRIFSSRHCPSEHCNPRGTVIPFGYYREIVPEIQQPSTWSGSVSSTIERLIGEEATFHDREVGAPISLIQISRDGPTWIKPGACEHTN